MKEQRVKEIKDREQRVKEIKDRLPHGAYGIISKMVGGRYQPRTIEAMFRDPELPSSRKMNDDVLDAAQKLIETINPKIEEYEHN